MIKELVDDRRTDIRSRTQRKDDVKIPEERQSCGERQSLEKCICKPRNDRDCQKTMEP